MKPEKSLFTKLTAIVAMIVLAALPVFAVPTPLTLQNLKVNNYAVAPGDLTITFAACDNVNGNSFAATGQDVLLVQNADGAAAHTFTVNSTVDYHGRIDTSLTGYSVALSTTTAIQIKFLSGWQQTNGTITLACNSTQIKFAVLHFS
jgi:hypothetical protein